MPAATIRWASTALRVVPYDSPNRKIGECAAPFDLDLARDEVAHHRGVGVDAPEVRLVCGAIACE